jgi:pimeloyl-ACP methyl ester carboxylesterase
MNIRVISMLDKPGSSTISGIRSILLIMICISVFGLAGKTQVVTTAPSSAGQQVFNAYVPFEDVKTTWHGFDRYDYMMDDATGAITPATPGVAGRRCIVVVPRKPAAGNPWSWRGCYWDHQPQTEVELLNRGFHICYVTVDMKAKPVKVDKYLEDWYAFLTKQHGMSKKPAYIGMSRGGEFAYIWATIHPDRVSCVYGDNPGDNQENLQRLEALAKQDVPLLNICGSLDPMIEKFSIIVENVYHEFGGRVSMMIKEGAGHHPHSLNDPKLIADFIEQSVLAAANPTPAPAYVGSGFKKYYYYSLETTFRNFPQENFYISFRGPCFTACYTRYIFNIPDAGETSIILPNKEAPGKPWVFHAGLVARNDLVTQALLAKGYAIVIAPETYSDNPDLGQWNIVYKTFTANGYSKKVVLAGAGGAAGELYGWAIENPDKVACLYAENPLMRSQITKKPLLDNLSLLAKAKVPLIHVCGSLDPLLADQTRPAEKRYKELGGQITVIVREGEGHFPLGTKDPKVVVDFIEKNYKKSLDN